MYWINNNDHTLDFYFGCERVIVKPGEVVALNEHHSALVRKRGLALDECSKQRGDGVSEKQEKSATEMESSRAKPAPKKTRRKPGRKPGRKKKL